ncbi:MAG: heme o synthase [Rhodospirillaceae bacterium]
MQQGIAAEHTGQDTAKSSEPATPVEAVAAAGSVRAKDYAILLKPRVMSLVVFTAIVGLLLAPGSVSVADALLAIFCVALGAGASGSINMWYDRDIDSQMARTQNRPIPAGRLKPAHALWLGIALSIVSVVVMTLAINPVASVLLAITIAFYVFIYTIWLKRRTPQNIVIGGAAGAFPPMIGWAVVSGSVTIESLILFLIIFMWTPPHFWALALYRCGDYEKAGIPMMPVVAGIRATKIQILVYSVLLAPTTLLPVMVGMSGWIYFSTAVLLNIALLYHAWRVWRDPSDPITNPGSTARPMFFFSIFYLFLVFVSLLVDNVLFFPI